MSSQVDASVHQRFSSQWGLFLSVLAISVGTGNIWRFPRIAANNGGDQGAGAFLIAWVCLLFLWSVPLIMAEYAMGRRTRSGTVGAFAFLAGRKSAWMGAFVAFVTAVITFYYAVVVGWCIYYFLQMVFAPLPSSTEASMAVWNGFQSSNLPVLFHGLSFGLAALVLWKGISSIEKVNKFLMPLLFGSVLISLVRALTLPGATEGIAYLFTPQFEQLSHPKIWLEALTQNAWDTGAGWGLFLTYGAHMRREHEVTRNAMITACGNNFVSLLAGIIVFGTLFGLLGTGMGMSQPEILKIARDSGPASTGLTLVWMPQLFAQMPLGRLLASVFFLGLALAGFTSLVAHIELQVRVLVDAGVQRKKAILAAIGVGFLLGVPSAYNLVLLGNQDFVWGVALMISGFLVAYAVIRYGVDKLRREELVARGADPNSASWWSPIIKYFVPPAAIALLIWWLSLSATVYAPNDWYDPFNPDSVMTCLVQWAVAVVLCVILAKRLIPKFAPPSSGQDD
jgi:NSS family neurotransmitter:Na+ symporter